MKIGQNLSTFWLFKVKIHEYLSNFWSFKLNNCKNFGLKVKMCRNLSCLMSEFMNVC